MKNHPLPFALRTLLISVIMCPFVLFAEEPPAAIERAHAELWKRFIDKHGVMIDFTDLEGRVNYPTPEECREGKPNALGWYQPIENGAMFNGLYMDAAVNRWRTTQSAEDAVKARRLMEGLLFLNSISDVRGFVGRGVSTDGRSHYPMGSNDQTQPWFYGLWRYWESELATAEDKKRIVKHLRETADVIVSLGWRMPAEPPYKTRGSFSGNSFGSAARRLFVMKIMHKITLDPRWQQMYRADLTKPEVAGQPSLRQVLAQGMVFTNGRPHCWTACCEVSALRGLWELEEDSSWKQVFSTGLQASAELASKSLSLAAQFDPQDRATFDQDWRAAMMPLWKPQATPEAAATLADQQLKQFIRLSPRRARETALVREPTSAAWIVTLSPDASFVQTHTQAIEQLISRYDYSRLYYCTFFWVENAWWRLR
jgi:hypothetical protein